MIRRGRAPILSTLIMVFLHNIHPGMNFLSTALYSRLRDMVAIGNICLILNWRSFLTPLKLDHIIFHYPRFMEERTRLSVALKVII